MSVGKRIKDIREAKKITQTDLAKAVHISKQTLWKYENDVIGNIPSDVIEAIAKYLCVSPGILMGWDATKNTCGYYYYYYYDENGETSTVPAPVKIDLSPHEQKVVEAYRAKPEMQPAVDTLLGIAEAEKENAAHSTSTPRSAGA